MSDERDLPDGMPSRVLRGQRPGKDYSPVTLEELKHFRRLIASVLLSDGEGVRPLFDRLEREIAEWEGRQDDRARLQALVAELGDYLPPNGHSDGDGRP